VLITTQGMITVGSEVRTAETFEHARVELHETITKQEDGPLTPISYLTITVPLKDDASLKAAYRIRDQVGGRGAAGSPQVNPHPAEEDLG
jgi:hypothetical protein